MHKLPLSVLKAMFVFAYKLGSDEASKVGHHTTFSKEQLEAKFDEYFKTLINN